MQADDFDTFWQAYPRKVGKGHARKAWKQTAPIRPELDALLAAIAAQRKTAQWMKDGGDYIPYPATWLRGERWDDALEVEMPKPERKLDRFDLANQEFARREAEWRARQAMAKAAA